MTHCELPPFLFEYAMTLLGDIAENDKGEIDLTIC